MIYLLKNIKIFEFFSFLINNKLILNPSLGKMIQNSLINLNINQTNPIVLKNLNYFRSWKNSF